MYAIRNAQTSEFFQGMSPSPHNEPTYGPNILESTPTWTDFEECQAYIVVNGLTLCEVDTIG